jgi:predicted outer membrane protein
MTRVLPTLLAALAVGSFALGEEKPAAPPAKQPEVRQNAQRPAERAQNAALPAERTASQEKDRVVGPLADCLILSNQEEIALLKLAQEKSKNDDVKKFVETAIKDHEKAISELQKFADHKGSELEVAAHSNSKDAAKAPSARRDVTALKPAGQSEDHAETMFAIAQQASQECLAMTKEQLNKADAEKKFDQCFLGQQIGMHIGMSAKLKAIQNNTSGEFQQLTSKLASTAQKHKEHAEKLMKDVESEKK